MLGSFFLNCFNFSSRGARQGQTALSLLPACLSHLPVKRSDLPRTTTSDGQMGLFSHVADWFTVIISAN